MAPLFTLDTTFGRLRDKDMTIKTVNFGTHCNNDGKSSFGEYLYPIIERHFVEIDFTIH